MEIISNENEKIQTTFNEDSIEEIVEDGVIENATL